jgi:hypothetical protein
MLAWPRLLYRGVTGVVPQVGGVQAGGTTDQTGRNRSSASLDALRQHAQASQACGTPADVLTAYIRRDPFPWL